MSSRALIFLLLALWLLIIVIVLDNQRRNVTPVLLPVLPTISTTPTPTSLTENLVIIGDTGTAYDSQFKTAKAVADFCKQNSCKAAVIAGDVIYPNGVESAQDNQFGTKFEKPYSTIDLPFYIAFGNHDALGCKSCYLEYAKKSAKWKQPAPYYVVEFDTVKMFVIDTEPFDLAQNSLLMADLAVPATKTKIVVGHRPFTTDEKTHHGENWQGKDLLLQTICNKADIYVAGHAHLLEHSQQINNCRFEQFISGGGGADVRPTVENPTSRYLHSGNGFMVISNVDEKTGIQFYSSDGSLLYKYDLRK